MFPVLNNARPSGKKVVARQQRRGLRTREAILARAVDIASIAGLEGLTVGSLAEQLRMSKSGLFAHFGSKEELQLATVEKARKMVIGQVTRPATAPSKGMARGCVALKRVVVAFVAGTFWRGSCRRGPGRRRPVRRRGLPG